MIIIMDHINHYDSHNESSSVIINYLDHFLGNHTVFGNSNLKVTPIFLMNQ